MIRSAVRKILQSILSPNMFLDFQTWRKGYVEPELKLIPLLCDPSKMSIDIGADDGLYLSHIYKYSKKCIAFEPRVMAFQNLEKLFSGKPIPVKIEPIALSNTTGNTQLKIFKKDGGRSTIESTNFIENYGEIILVTVPVRKMDDYIFDETIGFIKIDVEGHEQAVIEGGLNVIKKHEPTLLIEIEERHKTGSIPKVIQIMTSLGYRCFFYDEGKLKDIKLFDVKIHQNIEFLNDRKKYINNFIFVTSESIEKLVHLF